MQREGENVMKTTGILRSIVVSITLFVVALIAPTRASALLIVMGWTGQW